MKIAVRYMAQLRQAAGVPSEVVEVEPPCLLPDLLRRLADRHGEPFRRLLLTSDGLLQPTLLLFLGENQVRWNCPVTLKDGDVVTLLSPIAGG